MARNDPAPADALMLEGLYWWDVATFFRCPVERNPDRCDVALVGVPHSTGNGTTERDRHPGPRAVRGVSATARRVHMEFGIDPWGLARIRDMGDVPHRTDYAIPADELIVVGAVRIIRRRRLRGMAQSGSAPALGAGSRGFKSLCPDQRGVSLGHHLEMRP